MILNSTADVLKVSLGGAVTTNELSCLVGYSQSKLESPPLSRAPILTNGATAVTLISGIANQWGSVEVYFINIYNSDTANATVTIKYVAGESGDYILFKQLLAPGESLQYTKTDGFFLRNLATEQNQELQIIQETLTNTNLENLLNRNNGTFDAFYRMRFSEPKTIFDSKQIADKQALIWDDQLVSGAGGATTYNTNQASTTLSVALNTAAVRVRQTFRHFNYQSGKSQLIVMTGIFGTAGTGIKRKAGLYNSNNGIFFDQQSDGMGVTIRTYTSGSAVDTRVLQANWNIDKMDGTGASGINLDYSKTLIWFCDYEWLGVGTVRYGFFVGGRPYYCHEVNNSNASLLVYMSTPNLPLRYEIENTGTGAAVGFTHICSAVISEGGSESTGFPFSLNRGATPLITLNDSSIYPLFAMRLQSGYVGSDINILDFSINCTSTASYNYYILLNPTVTGTALSFTSITNSSVEAQENTTNATKVSGGTLLFSKSATQGNDSGGVDGLLRSTFALGSNIAGTADVLVLAVQRVSGTTETFYGSLNFLDQQ